MTTYHYVVLEKPGSAHLSTETDAPNMESVDYKRQPDVYGVRHALARAGAYCCGIFRGGLFGLKTSQISMLLAWESAVPPDFDSRLCVQTSSLLIRSGQFRSTVRPQRPETISRAGFYVIRWLEMHPADILEYTQLCLETWPAFEADGTARCFGVFRPLEDSDPVTLLMLTWYHNLDAWERSRTLTSSDTEKWVRRSQMELRHWAEAARLAS